MPIIKTNRTVSKIVYPSSFKLEITEIQDGSGNKYNLASTNFIFKFTDGVNNSYTATYYYDDSDACEHCYYSNGKIYIIFENYNLSQDLIYLNLCVREKDDSFASGWMDTWFEKMRVDFTLTYNTNCQNIYTLTNRLIVPSFANAIENIELNGKMQSIEDRLVKLDTTDLDITEDEINDILK